MSLHFTCEMSFLVLTLDFFFKNHTLPLFQHNKKNIDKCMTDNVCCSSRHEVIGHKIIEDDIERHELHSNDFYKENKDYI